MQPSEQAAVTLDSTLQPVAVSDTVHTAHAASWLAAIGQVVTPENVQAVATLLAAIAPFFGRRK